jgi:hypothetical protein
MVSAVAARGDRGSRAYVNFEYLVEIGVGDAATSVHGSLFARFSSTLKTENCESFAIAVAAGRGLVAVAF